jgi:8-oxo-dGTP pyrophosphatase MutT (NUDIX family)
MHEIVAAGGLVFSESNCLLMIFRRGYWDLPKGKIDHGETVEEAALREVKEETGLKDLKILAHAGSTHHRYFDRWLNKEVMKRTEWFVMSGSGLNALLPQTEEDITEACWVSEEELPDLLNMSFDNIREIIFQNLNYFKSRI